MSGLREVLDRHDYNGWRCGCGWEGVYDEHLEHVEAAVLAWVRDEVVGPAAEYVALVGRIHEVYRHLVMDTPEDREIHARHVETADKALALASERLAGLTTGHETRSGAPLADKWPEVAPGDHRDDERLSGPGMGEL